MPGTKSPPKPSLWRSLGEYEDQATSLDLAHDEFPAPLPLEASPAPAPDVVVPLRLSKTAAAEPPRRDFFRMMGLSATAAMAACNRAPKQNILPYTHRPEAIVPGLAVHYATSCQACPARCGLLVKTREGRPIKVEGNPRHPVSQGAVCPMGQAAILGLYDADRARAPKAHGKQVSWGEVDLAVAQGLHATEARPLYLVVPFGLGPSENAALAAFAAKHTNARVVRFDPLQERAAVAQAHQLLYGQALIPDYRFDLAQVIVSFGADFLGSWLNPASFSRQWSAGRDLGGKVARRERVHVQLESHMSLAGGAADERHALSPQDLRGALAAIVARLAQGHNLGLAFQAAQLAAKVGTKTTMGEAALDDLAKRLLKAGDAALVVCGSDDVAEQTLAAMANALLGNQVQTANLVRARREASDADWETVISALEAGNVAGLVFWGTNPAMADRRLQTLLPKVKFKLSTSAAWDETAQLCDIHAPQGHAFESWSDSEPRQGVFVVNQPTVSPLFDTRSGLASLLTWAQRPESDHDWVMATWQKKVLANASETFLSFWQGRLREGAFEQAADVPAPALASNVEASTLALTPHSEGPQLLLHASLALGDGSHANNGWLQELPDPVTKLTWGNVAALSPAFARKLGVKDGDHVQVSRGDVRLVLPALIQAGTADHTVAIALGHGRALAGRNAKGHGVNAWPLALSNARLAHAGAVQVAKASGRSELYLAQVHNSQEGRAFVRQASLEEFFDDPKHAGHPEAHPELGHGLWDKHEYKGHRWALAIDLDKCTGCGACVVSCQAENNIPMVGPAEVAVRRDMHWLRIDRYYGGTPENPEMLHQPMMCQHCENAPCETVCPVLATVHSEEGLNQQIYNRCVGTRYCANNCPTKVRRFNWFDYPHDEPLERMVLNPDVVVRTRGVMEKCSMCVHRIEEGKALAKREGRALADGDVKTACQQSCPGQAIFFGDANDPQSAVSQAAQSPRAYKILTELNIGPSVSYQVRLKNKRHG